jgi:hypothetical protein
MFTFPDGRRGRGRRAFAARDKEATMSTDFVTLQDVQVLQATELAMLCRIGARDVWIPTRHIGTADRVVRTRGDRGLLVIPTWLVHDLGLDDYVRPGREHAR